MTTRARKTTARLSPCKVNLLLNILGKRADGFHELETVFHPVALHDELEFWIGGAIGEVTLTCNNPALPTDAGNLVYRAAQKFLEAAKISEGVELHLEKRVPLAAGLGGGSSNAAVTLLGLNELFGGPLDFQNLTEIAAGLGSDVPFFLQDRPALGVGRGEQIQSLEPFASLAGVYIVLIHPGFGISTAWAYKNLARFPEALNGRRGRAAELIKSLRSGSLEQASGGFYNSLEAPALEKFPILAMFQEFFRENGASVSLMSGSGSTTFALARSRELAEELMARFKVKFGDGGWMASAPLQN
jgi:4-diphosphocytidyl-2-C-methyl-D-erythritol kinase